MQSRKLDLALLILVVFFGFQIQAESKKSEFYELQYGPCSFACKSIPEEKDVLQNISAPTTVELRSTRIKILVWNIYKGKLEKFSRDFDRYSQNKDLVLLSEVTTEVGLLASLRALPGFGWMMAASFLMKNDSYTGTAIGSATEAQGTHFYRTTDLEPFVKSPKTMIVAEFRLPNSNKKLLAISIHGINFAGDAGLDRQLNQILPELTRHDGPIVFAGDFNTKNSSRVALTQGILRQAGLERVNWQNPPSGKQLDDAFVRGVRVNEARFIYEVVGQSSDHPALELDLNL